MRVPYGPKRYDPIVEIPNNISNSLHEAGKILAEFLRKASKGRGTCLVTGAGISVASGIPDYRGPEGTYTANKTYRPIFFNEFVEGHNFRQRYWARSFLGYPPVAKARPNLVHNMSADMLRKNLITITQNVDGLHTYNNPDLKDRVTELHGSLHRVVCLSCHNVVQRSWVQNELERLNPSWTNLALPLKDGSTKDIKTNPDGDVDLPKNEGVHYSQFRYPPCQVCLKNGQAKGDKEGAWSEGGGVLKPSVVFFGESVPADNKTTSDVALLNSDALLCMGTSLAVYSAFRFVKAARAGNKPIAIINRGHVRDEEKWINEAKGDIRMDMDAGSVLTEALRLLSNET